MRDAAPAGAVAAVRPIRQLLVDKSLRRSRTEKARPIAPIAMRRVNRQAEQHCAQQPCQAGPCCGRRIHATKDNLNHLFGNALHQSLQCDSADPLYVLTSFILRNICASSNGPPTYASGLRGRDTSSTPTGTRIDAEVIPDRKNKTGGASCRPALHRGRNDHCRLGCDRDGE